MSTREVWGIEKPTSQSIWLQSLRSLPTRRAIELGHHRQSIRIRKIRQAAGRTTAHTVRGDMMKTETQKDYEQRILRVLIHVQENLDVDLQLDELASLAHFSPYHFHRIFRGMVGEPVKEHVRRLRLERAAHHLKTTDRSVTAVAFDAGYETHESFTRAFRAMFNDSPSGFREARRASTGVVVSSGIHYSPTGALDSFEPSLSEVESMNVDVKKVKAMRVAFMRHIGPYDQVGNTWQKFMGFAFSHGLFGPTAKMLAIVHDDPDVTPPERLRYDACMVVGDKFQPEGDVGVQQISGGSYAVTTHHGPYDRLGETYAALMGQWLPAHNREPTDAPCFEVYLNNPQQTPPEDLRTEVYVPLELTGDV